MRPIVGLIMSIESEGVHPDVSAFQVKASDGYYPHMADESTSVVGLYEVSSSFDSKLNMLPSHLQVAQYALERGEIQPGSVECRSRFAAGMPFAPVQLVSSELLEIFVHKESVRSIFIQHQLHVQVDEEMVREREEYAQMLSSLPYQRQPDQSIRYRIPKLSLEEFYERMQSRPNGIGWSGKQERVAAFSIMWNGKFDSSGAPIIYEEYLTGVTLDDKINTYHKIKSDLGKLERLSREREKVIRMIEEWSNSEYPLAYAA